MTRDDTSEVFSWRKGERAGTETEESVDIAARLHPYEELFNEAMTMAARFAEERDRRDRERARETRDARPTLRVLRRRAS